MRSYDDDHDPLDDGPALSHEAVTPRGGFMARPGLKSPPRHAVVVRVGDAPESEHIPLARASVPPPAPPSEPPPVSASEKITLRAIPTPSTPPPAVEAPPSALPRVVESLPPPSDAPFVHSVGPSASSAPRSRRSSKSSSRWTIVIAAAAGLLLGLASVLTTMRAQQRAASAPVAAPTIEVVPARPALKGAADVAPSASARPVHAADEPASAAAQSASRPANQGAKHSIF